MEGGVFVGGFGFGWSPRMPSLNSRTPWPRPRITSGILRPPKSTSTTMAIISKCIGLSHITHLPFWPHNIRQAASPTDYTPYSITRSSPTRRVTRSRSRYSSSGMAYFRVMPVSSLNTGIGNLFAAFFAVFGEHFAQLRDGRAVKNKLVRHLDEHFFAQQHLQDFLRSLRFNRQLFEHCREAWNERPARSNSFSISSFAFASSAESAISRPARWTRSPVTVTIPAFTRSSRAAANISALVFPARPRRSCFGIPGSSGLAW